MLIKVKVFPQSKKQALIQKSEDSFEVKVKSKPEGGRANEETKQILAEHFQISTSKIKLIRGGKSKNKIFEISSK